MDTNQTNRSHCGISCALDTLGDKWSLLIVRDIVLLHKKTFKEFVASSERIATNILADRLKKLETHGLITKRKAPNSLKVNHYSLTEKGLSLIPLLLELQSWAYDNLENATGKITKTISESYHKNKTQTVHEVKKNYLESL
jgi:DNA-binding HxlR family transcriptional regulator